MSTLYETGHATWDIGQILTVHESTAHGDATDCHRVLSLLATRGRSAEERLAEALAVRCTCRRGATMGVPEIERTSLRRKDAQNAQSADETPGRPGV